MDQVKKKKSPKQPRGIALLIVLMSLSLITAIVVDMGEEQFLNYRLAIHERNALQAEALAKSGIELSRLMILVQGKLQGYFAQMASSGLQLPLVNVWQLLPLDSEMMKGLASGDLLSLVGIDIKDVIETRLKGKQSQQQKKTNSDDKAEEKKQAPSGGFGDFEGSFHVDIIDEESKISLRPWGLVTDVPGRRSIAEKLYALFQPEIYDELFDGTFTKGTPVDRWSLVANLFDWVDDDDVITDPKAPGDFGKTGGGSEKSLYLSYKDVYPRNAFFDSLEELRMVHGMSDAHMAAFADAITLYGEGNKVNLLTASDKVMGAIIRYCAQNDGVRQISEPNFVKETLAAWKRYRQKGEGPITPQGFTGFLKTRPLEIDEKRCEAALGTSSQNYTVKSTGTVGGVSRTLTTVLRSVGNAEDFYYFRAN